MRRPVWPPFLTATLLLFTVLVFGTRPIVAQLEATCPALVLQALTDAESACAGLGRNSACYGYNRVAATFFQDVAADFFRNPSDRGALDLFQTIRTSVLDVNRSQWGVAFLNVQANVPDTLPGQGVVFVLMGDTEVLNDVTPDEAFHPADAIALEVTQDTVLRSEPAANANVIVDVPVGAYVQADGLSTDSAWLRVVREDAVGWIDRTLVTGSSDIDALPALTADLQTPMQAFRFRTGIGQPTCEQAPDALVVQGPTQMNVNITANGANIQLGSTVVLQTTSSEDEATVLPGHDREARSVTFLPGGEQAVTGDDAGVIRLWDSNSGETLQTLTGHEGPVVGLGVLADGTRLVSAGADGTLRFWSLPDGAAESTVETGSAISEFALSPDGTTAATGDADGNVRLWNTATGEAAGSFNLAGLSVTALAFSPDGGTLAVGASDGSVHLFDVATQAEISVMQAHTSDVLALAFRPDGSALASSGAGDVTRLWSLPDGAELANFTSNGAQALAFSPDGYTLAIETLGSSIDLWDVDAGSIRATLDGHSGAILDLKFNDDGTQLASGSGDTTARLWWLSAQVMTLFTIDGHVVADGVVIPEGYMATVRLDQNGQVAGNWSNPVPIPPEDLVAFGILTGIPDDTLHYPIVLPGGPIVPEIVLNPTATPTPDPTAPPDPEAQPLNNGPQPNANGAD